MTSLPVHDGKAGLARGYSWEQFQPGNFMRLAHGARSERVYGPLAEDLIDQVLVLRPDLRAFPWEVIAWAEAEARVALLRLHMDHVGPIGDDGEPRAGLLKWLSVFERLAAERRRTLGFDPRSAAELARTRAEAAHASVDLDAVLSAGRAVIADRPSGPQILIETTGEGE